MKVKEFTREELYSKDTVLKDFELSTLWKHDDGDEDWYDGKVIEYNPDSKHPFHIKYDDGDQEWGRFLDDFTVFQNDHNDIRDVKWIDDKPALRRSSSASGLAPSTSQQPAANGAALTPEANGQNLSGSTSAGRLKKRPSPAGATKQRKTFNELAQQVNDKVAQHKAKRPKVVGVEHAGLSGNAASNAPAVKKPSSAKAASKPAPAAAVVPRVRMLQRPGPPKPDPAAAGAGAGAAAAAAAASAPASTTGSPEYHPTSQVMSPVAVPTAMPASTSQAAQHTWAPTTTTTTATAPSAAAAGSSNPGSTAKPDQAAIIQLLKANVQQSGGTSRMRSALDLFKRQASAPASASSAGTSALKSAGSSPGALAIPAAALTPGAGTPAAPAAAAGQQDVGVSALSEFEEGLSALQNTRKQIERHAAAAVQLSHDVGSKKVIGALYQRAEKADRPGQKLACLYVLNEIIKAYHAALPKAEDASQVDGHQIHAALPTYLAQLVRAVVCDSDNLAKVERLVDGWLNSSWYTVEQLRRAKDVLAERRTFLGPGDAGAAAAPAPRGATTAALQQLAAQQLHSTSVQGPPAGRRVVLNKPGQPFGPETVETRLSYMYGSMARLDSWLLQHLQLPFRLQLDLDGDLGADEELAGAEADPTPCVWKVQFPLVAAQDPVLGQELQLMVGTPERMMADLAREQQGLQPGDYVDGGSSAEAQIEEVDFWESDYGQVGAVQEGIQEEEVEGQEGQEYCQGDASGRSSPHTLLHTAPPAAPQWEMRDDDEDMDLDDYRPGSEELPQCYTGRVSGTSPQEGFAAGLPPAGAGGMQARGGQLGLGLGLGLGNSMVPGQLGVQQMHHGMQVQQQVPGLMPGPPGQQQQVQQQPWLQQQQQQQQAQVSHQQPPAWQQQQQQLQQQPQQMPQQMQQQQGLAAAPWQQQQQQQMQQQRQQPPGPLPPPLHTAPGLAPPPQQQMQQAVPPLQQAPSWQHLPPHLLPGNAGPHAPPAAPPPAAGMAGLTGHLPLPPPPADMFMQQQQAQQAQQQPPLPQGGSLKSSWAQMQEKQQLAQQAQMMQQQQHRLSGGLGSMPSYGMAGQVPLQGVPSYGMQQPPLPPAPGSMFHGGFASQPPEPPGPHPDDLVAPPLPSIQPPPPLPDDPPPPLPMEEAPPLPPGPGPSGW